MSEMGLSVRESSVGFTACSSPAKLSIDALDAKKYLSFAMSSCVTVAPALLPSALSNAERRSASEIVTAAVGETGSWIAVCAAGPSPSEFVARNWKW